MDRFTEDGRWIIPINEFPEPNKPEDDVRFLITEAYCPNGCNIMDEDHKIGGKPGLRIKYSRPGMEGEFVLSAIEGDFNKIMLSGELEHGVRDDLFCPHCGVKFATLVNCNCHTGANLILIGLTPKLDINNAITFCDVTGCGNGSFILSGEVLRHLRLGN